MVAGSNDAGVMPDNVELEWGEVSPGPMPTTGQSWHARTGMAGNEKSHRDTFKGGPHDAPLSIINAIVARFTPTSATWLFDRPSVSDVIHTDTLARSLRATLLDAYPQLAGLLHWAPWRSPSRTQALVTFARDWAAVNLAMLAGAPAPILEPVFDPQQLDAAAAGDIDADAPDLDMVQKARALPLHRYDFWAGDASAAPAELATNAALEQPRHALPARALVAASICEAMTQFTPDAVAALLHERAFASCPHRF
ncbi:hypothetical protein AURDEDRAFT_131303 [Auricularia subglabra TFB-10046 SS5]|uniref:Uncharacterized protein n=1 Tax=Auricularia subglabra (strain TFB-10046 / SS5) TaxID=717982 RepID=J0LCE4_AURST|nr:hypothetical protein AURDEDRAFT_131303 [Auricularia subglabra TFB-10046 SS5]